MIIPVKPPGEGKLRLAEVLDGDARNRLVDAMLDQVLDAVSAARFVDRICILGPSRHGQSTAIPLLGDPGGGLNAALSQALAEADAGGASRVVFIAADLPRITPRDVEALTGAAEGVVAIASDRHGTGTNAIALPLPQAKGFTFAYGTDSFAAHDGEAYRLGLDIEIVSSPGLARDVDFPEDLRDAAKIWAVDE